MHKTLLVIEEGVALPPPSRPGTRRNAGLLGQIMSMSAGQSALLTLPEGAQFASWRASVGSLMSMATARVEKVRFTSRREGDGVRIFCVAAEG